MIYRRPAQPSPAIVAHYTPRWRVPATPPEPGKLHVPSVPTAVYSTAKNTERKRRCETWLSWAAFKTWCFVDGTPCDDHHAPIVADHARLLQQNDPPFLILEDDAEPAEWRSNLVVPTGAEILYLGGFRNSPGAWQDAARSAGLDFKYGIQYGYTDETPDWIRVLGMWGSHAILWLSKPAMMDAAALLLAHKRHVDDNYALNMHRWRVWCLKRPLVWQNDGRHLLDTKFYWPPSSKRRRSR